MDSICGFNLVRYCIAQTFSVYMIYVYVIYLVTFINVYVYKIPNLSVYVHIHVHIYCRVSLLPAPLLPKPVLR